MKRILFVLAVIGSMAVGCKKEKMDEKPATAIAAVDSVCNTSVILSKNEIEKDTTFVTWKASGYNASLICDDISTGDMIHIDLNRYPNDTDHAKKGAWLTRYGKYVLDKESQSYILNSHTIDQTLYEITPKSNVIEKEVSEIKGFPGIPAGTFDTSFYGKYLNITHTVLATDPTTGKLRVDMEFNYVSGFSANGTTVQYSVPLLRAIVSELNDHDKIEFSIVKVKNLSTDESGDLLVINKKGAYIFYDYTNYPTFIEKDK